MPVEKHLRETNVVPEAGRIPHGGLMLPQDAVELLFNPRNMPEHDINRDSRFPIDPLVSWLPVFVSELRPFGSGRDPSPSFQRNHFGYIDIQVNIGMRVMQLGGLRSRQY